MFGFEGGWAFQWHEIFKFGKWNWVNFDFCNISFEVCWFEGKSFECVFIILGLGFYLQWYDKAWHAHAEKGLERLFKDINDDVS